ncbi:MAG TPA: TetR/AcrR family transcriptional regulator [Firmicutes bacterium]|nr:TetR/AcrR family transcriptional regulator [Bacillota bacterium]
MVKQLEDRRIRRTKKILKESLLELMKKKKIKDITIKDITDAADLNRGTFYLHYADIYDLLDQIENEIIQDIFEMVTEFNTHSENKSTYELLLQLFGYIYENKTLFIILMSNKNDNTLMDKVQTFIKTMGLETVKMMYHDSPTDYQTFTLAFVSSGILGVTEHWFERGMDLPPETMAQLVDQIISNGATLLLNSVE